MRDIAKKHAYFPAGEIVAENVSEEEYFAYYTESRHEWVEGFVIKVSPGTLVHTALIRYFDELLRAYVRIKPIGEVFRDPSMMRFGNSIRIPDVFFVLATNPAIVTKTGIRGVADLCIEVVSEDSITRDYAEKKVYYETAGVQEYWVIDPLQYHAIFYQRQATGDYLAVEADSDGYYAPSILPKLKINVPTLWQTKLPDMVDSLEMLKGILE